MSMYIVSSRIVSLGHAVYVYTGDVIADSFYISYSRLLKYHCSYECNAVPTHTTQQKTIASSYSSFSIAWPPFASSTCQTASASSSVSTFVVSLLSDRVNPKGYDIHVPS
jgi:hypothetical protein